MSEIRHVVVYPSRDWDQYTNTDVLPINQGIAYLQDMAKAQPSAEISGWSGVRVKADVTISDLQLMQEKAQQLRDLLNAGILTGFTADEVRALVAKL